MKIDTLIKSNEILSEIKRYENLKKICSKPFFRIKKPRILFDYYESYEYFEADNEFRALIFYYCDIKIKKLHEELEKI